MRTHPRQVLDDRRTVEPRKASGVGLQIEWWSADHRRTSRVEEDGGPRVGLARPAQRRGRQADLAPVREPPLLDGENHYRPRRGLRRRPYRPSRWNRLRLGDGRRRRVAVGRSPGEEALVAAVPLKRNPGAAFPTRSGHDPRAFAVAMKSIGDITRRRARAARVLRLL